MKKRVLLDFFQKLIFQKKLVLCLLVIPLMVANAYAQTISVSGVIKDEGGLPLPGVAVTVKGTTSGTMTNENGQFKLTAPTNGVLQLKYLGFLSQEVAVNNRTSINVTLREDISRLDEVIVVGYGTQTKRDVTGGISRVDAKTIEERVPVNIFDALQGAAAGIRVASDSGAPGEEASINIRGVSSISENGGAPLYVVDGIIVDNINGISPNDVESIEILKDAASAAVYGSRSANGVVLITTKKGQEGKPRINFVYTNSYSNLAHKLPQANRLEREGFEQSNLPTRFGLYPVRNDSTAYGRNNDWDYQDLITQTGVRSQYDLNFSGGTKNLTYYTGIQYLDNQGIILSSEEKRTTLRTNVDYRPNDKILIASRLTFGLTNSNQIDDGRVLSQSSQRPASQALYLPDGTPIFDNGGRKHPIEEARLRGNVRDRYNAVLGQIFEYKFSKSLLFHADVAATATFNENRTFSSGFLETSGQSRGTESLRRTTRLQTTAYLNYTKSFNNAHNLTAQIGNTVEDENSRVVSVGGTDFITESINTLNALSLLNPSQTNSDGTGSSFVGFWARAGYNYKQKYLINGVIRRDGSSRFGPANRWGNFPAVSVGWRLSDENFMKWSKNFLTDAKFRATWGIQGTASLGDFVSRNLLDLGGFFYNGVSGVVTGRRLGNNLLKWEEQTQSDIGLDLTLFGGRLAVEASYYQRITKDLISEDALILPAEIGRPDNAFVNAGAIRNRGLEVQISGYPIRNTAKNISLNTTLFLGYNKNVITDLPGEEIITANQLYIIREGEPAGRFFGFRALGIYAYDQSNAYTEDFRTRLMPVFQTDAAGNVVFGSNFQPTLLGYNLPDGTPYNGVVRPLTVNGAVSRGGDVIWENLPDANGNVNGDISVEDRQILGSGIPKLQVSLNNTFNYKRFGLSVFVYGSFGNKVYNSLARTNAQFSSTNVTPFPDVIRNMWKYPGQITDVYQRNLALNNSRPGNSYFLEDGSFIRLQTVRLNYQMPEKYSKAIFTKSLSLFAFSNNLATWTNYSGFDPEVGQRNVLQPGNDVGRFPRRREFGFGLNASF